MTYRTPLWRRILVYFVIILGGLLMMFPLIWSVLTSFKSEYEAMLIPPTLLPNEWTFENYNTLFNEMNFGVYTKNSLILVLFSFVTLAINMLAGYGFSKFRFKHKEKIFLIILATLMIPGQATMIPNYILITLLGLNNTMAGIVVPGLAGAFSIFLFRQFIDSVPDELIEAAKIDGAGQLRIFLQVVVPMCKPIIAVQAILGIIGAWNNFLWPLIVANSERLYPLAVALALLKGQHATDFALQMAGSSLMIVPVIIVFLFFQKYIVEGYMTSGLK